MQLFSDTGITSLTSAPAWFFRNAGAGSNSASITGSISGTTLTVSDTVTGTVAVGQIITGNNVAANTTITGFLSGTNGGDGTYSVSTSQTVVSETLSLSGSTAFYGLAVAELNGVTGSDANAPANSDFIQFQGYRAVAIGNGTGSNAAGAAAGPSFQITPDLSHYASGAIDLINQEASSGNHTGAPTALQFAPNVGPGSGYSLAWNDIVTDSNGTHEQVEFAIYGPSLSPGQQLVSQSTFQIADGNAQNIRLATTTINGVNVAILAYGDDTGTHVVEFNATSAAITGTISGNTLTVSAVSAGSLAIGDAVTGAGIAANTTITAFGTGRGGDGTYTLSTTNSVTSAEFDSRRRRQSDRIFRRSVDHDVRPAHPSRRWPHCADLRQHARCHRNHTNRDQRVRFADAGPDHQRFGVNHRQHFGQYADRQRGLLRRPRSWADRHRYRHCGQYDDHRPWHRHRRHRHLYARARRRLFPPSPSARISATARTNTSPAPAAPTRSPARTMSTTSDYYVGADTTIGSGPNDTFNGGTGGWNVAVFADGMPDYSVVALAGGYVVTENVDAAHSGSLTVNGNVETLAFAPTQDPTPPATARSRRPAVAWRFCRAPAKT